MAVEGWGSELYSSFNGTDFTARAEVREIHGPNSECKVVYNSSLAHAQSGKLNSKPGLVDYGEVSLRLNFTAAEWRFWQSIWRNVLYWIVAFSDGTMYFNGGYIIKVGAETKVDDAIQLPVSIKLTGIPISFVFPNLDNDDKGPHDPNNLQLPRAISLPAALPLWRAVN